MADPEIASIPFITSTSLFELVSWPDAIESIAEAVRQRAAQVDIDRIPVTVSRGELLLMPAESVNAVGVKVLSVAPDNPSRKLPRIQAVYVLFDSSTLTPTALFDGAGLTSIRTPAVSALAVALLADPDASRLTVFGAGPQAEFHIAALQSIRPIRQVTIVARRRKSAAALAQRLSGHDLRVTVGSAEDVRDADIVVCATTAKEPLFDGTLLPRHCCVVAVGSHEPDARELDDEVFRHATRVVVEDRRAALREAGDVIQARRSGAIADDASLIDLAELQDLPVVSGRTVFKSVGMGWQDLAIAQAAWRRAQPSA